MSTDSVRNHRGRLLTGAAAVAVAAGMVAAGGTAASAAQQHTTHQGRSTQKRTAKAAKPPVTFVISVRALDNAYSAAWVKGADGLVKTLGYPTSDVKVLQSGNNDEAQVTQLQSLLASTSGKVAIVVDPNTNAITQSIVTAVQHDPNAYVTVFWNKPNNLWPWNYSHWVSFINFNGVVSGKQTANVLFSKMDNKGGIIALQGILNNVPAQQRFSGLEQALKAHHGVKLLAQETANWDETQAFNITKSLLAKYGSKIKGVWAANDEMAVGAEQALKDTGAKNVPVVSASDAIPQVLHSIKSHGGIYATTNPDGYWDGSTGLALSYYAAIGKLNTAKMSRAHRAFYAQAQLVTAANVGRFLANPSPAQYRSNWTLQGLFKRYQGAITG